MVETYISVDTPSKPNCSINIYQLAINGSLKKKLKFINYFSYDLLHIKCTIYIYLQEKNSNCRYNFLGCISINWSLNQLLKWVG